MNLIYPGEDIYKLKTRNYNDFSTKKTCMQNPPGGFFSFCRINSYLCEKRKYVGHEILNRTHLV